MHCVTRVSDAIFATLDVMPTLAVLAGFEMPGDRVIDGVDQVDLLLGKSEKGNRNDFLYLNNAVRQGKWKYLRAVHKVPGYAADRKREKVEELYDLEADLGERNNLASSHPEKVAELRKLMEAISGRAKKPVSSN